MPRLKRGTTANRRGLTLPELLVAMLLLAIVGGGVTRVMMKQQQFYKDASKTAGAKRELRLGASVMPAELRSISSSGGDILEMSESQIRMRAYIGSAVICAINNDDIWVVPRNLARHTLTTYVTIPAGGDTLAYTIANDRPHPLIEAFGLNRFASAALVDEGAAAGVAH